MDTASNQTEPGCLLLNADEAARLLGISRRHLHKLNVTGRLPRPIRLGRVVRWRADELHNWIAAGCPSRDRWESVKHRE